MAQLTGESKRQYVSELFARISSRYDLMNDLMTAGRHRSWKRTTARLTTKGLRGNALDVATGTGDLAIALSRCLGIDRAVGVDLLPEMLALGRSKVKHRGFADTASLLLGDALELPFSDGSFACATSGFTLRNVPDLRRTLSEMVRVVQPGGRVTSLELTPLLEGKQSSLLRWYFHQVVPLLGQLVGGDRAAYTYLPQSVDRFPNADCLAELFRELGLTDVGYQRMGLGMVTLHWGTKPIN